MSDSSTTKQGDKSNPPPKLKIRQDRHQIPDMRSYLKVGKDSLEIINFSAFGLAVHSKNEIKEDHITGAVFIEDQEFDTAEFRVVRNQKDAHGFRVALEVKNKPLQVESMMLFPKIKQIISEYDSRDKHYSQLPHEFRLVIFELSHLLDGLNKKVSELEKTNKFLSFLEQEEFESLIIDVLGRKMNDEIRKCNHKLQELLSNTNLDLLRIGLDFFRDLLKDYIYQSPFADRSFKKPLGYAGDFEMMNLIYRNESLGPTLFARCMERAMQLHPEPQAVRNRATYLLEKIQQTVGNSKSHPVKILSVACGPAHEIQRFIMETDPATLQNVEIHILDQDENALKSAQLAILGTAQLQGKHIKLILIQKNIRNLIIEGLEDEQYDLIYSAGLFDYFSDSVARKACSTLLNHTKKAGSLIIGNFNATTPNSFGMKTLFDWHLILRSKDELTQLYGHVGHKIEVESEPNEINLFCTIQKT